MQKSQGLYGDEIGKDETKEELIEEYVDFFVKTFKDEIKENISSEFVVGIDTANGATYKIAEKIFTELRNTI